MWEYATIRAISLETDLPPYIPMCVKIELEELFEKLPMSSFDEIAQCTFYFKKSVSSLDEWMELQNSSKQVKGNRKIRTMMCLSVNICISF